MKKFLIATAMTVILTSASVVPAQAQNMTRQDVENIVREFIINNPEVILDSVEAYGNAQQASRNEDRQKAVEEHLDWLEKNDSLPVAGNPKGDVTIVEFFDYNCGYCKRALTDVMTIIEEDKDVRLVFIEMPILGRTSELAARWAMAAKEQGQYLEYHIALMKHNGPLTEGALESIAENVGLDIAKMKKDADSSAVSAMIDEKTSKASQIGITGTPAFVIGGQLYGGYIGLEAMRQAVAEARKD